MNKQDQINQLANDIYSLFRSESMSKAMASLLYDKGYRKTSDIARKIFEEIENIAILNGYISVKDFYTEHPLIAELKKKHTEGEG